MIEDQVIWQGEQGAAVMVFDSHRFQAAVEALEGVQDHQGTSMVVYRVRLSATDLQKQMICKFTFHCTLGEYDYVASSLFLP